MSFQAEPQTIVEVKTYYCEDKCCKIYIHQTEKKSYIKPVQNYKKAGVFIYDPIGERVLLVQSRGNLFGPPKGSLNIGESNIDCAIREVKEETGIDITFSSFLRVFHIKNKATYYYAEMRSTDISVQNQILLNNQDNDANGITWIKMSCLEKAIYNGNIALNHYAKIGFERFFGKRFPKYRWTVIKYKKRNLTI